MTMDTSDDDDLANLLRDKVRNNALDLLNRLENLEKRRAAGNSSCPSAGAEGHFSPVPTTSFVGRQQKTPVPPPSINTNAAPSATLNPTALPFSPMWGEEKKDDPDRHANNNNNNSCSINNTPSSFHNSNNLNFNNSFANNNKNNQTNTFAVNQASTSSLLQAVAKSSGTNTPPLQILAQAFTNAPTPKGALTPNHAPSAAAAVSATSPKGDGSNSLELSRRLQQLALDREDQDHRHYLRVIQSDTNSHLHSAKTFAELRLPSDLLQAIYQQGFDRPSAIQAETLPRILQGRNVIAQAQSGSGKTAAFTIGMLFHINCNIQPPLPVNPQALCVTPTREIAIQILEKTVKPLSVNMKGLKYRLAVSGEHVDKGEKIQAHLIVGTPGKVVDWLKRKIFDPSQVKILVLDEADNMIQEKAVGGFRANSLLIKKQMKKDVQTLLFSATFSPEIVQFSKKLVKEADKILIEQGPEFLVLEEIKQLWIDTREYVAARNPGKSKILFLADIYNIMTIGQSIVFVASREEADLVFDTLSGAGYSCAVLHSRMETKERDQTMDHFRQNQTNVLITTNVLARGVDVDNVCLVINYNIPSFNSGEPDMETYLHRIGRTGRFGRKGTAVNLVTNDDERSAVLQICDFYSKSPSQPIITKIEADPEALADSIQF